MNKELKMELLNSEKQKQVQGGIPIDCPSAAQYYSDKPGGCSVNQNNVINCNNYEAKECGDGVLYSFKRIDMVKHLVY